MNAAASCRRASPSLLDGIAALPRDVAVSDLTQDSRAARPGGAFLAVHGTRRARPQVRAAGGRQRRARGAVGARAGRGGARPAFGDRWSRRCRACANTRARSPTASSARRRARWRWPASPAPTARPPAPICWRRRWNAAAGRPPTSARSAPAGRAALVASALTTGDAVTVQRTLAQSARRRRRQRGDGSLLARARPGARRRGAVPHRRVHQPHARPSRLPRHDGELRRRQGAAVHARDLRVARDQRRRRVRPRSSRIDPRGRGRARSSPAAVTSRARAARRASCAPCTSSCRRAASSSSSIRAGAPARCVCPLIGDFNVDNLLAVIAVLLDWDVAARAGRSRALARVHAAPGRMETFGGARRAARGGRLRAHARRAAQGAGARRARMRAAGCVVRVRLRRRPRSPASAR